MSAIHRSYGLEVVEGDLLEQDVDVIVNAWNRNIIPWWLLWPQGVSGAIKRSAGIGPFVELGWRPMPLGTARVTGAGRLKYRAIIHVAGINILWRASENSVQKSVVAALDAAFELGSTSLALPVLGAGSGGMSEARALEVITATLEEVKPAMRVIVVRFRK